MTRFSNPDFNRQVRRMCRAIHEQYADSVTKEPAVPGENGGFDVVYVVAASDKKQVIKVTYDVGEDAWTIQSDTPFFSMIALSDCKNVEFQFDPVGAMKRLCEDAQGGRLWKGEPRIDG